MGKKKLLTEYKIEKIRSTFRDTLEHTDQINFDTKYHDLLVEAKNSQRMIKLRSDIHFYTRKTTYVDLPSVVFLFFIDLNETKNYNADKTYNERSNTIIDLIKELEDEFIKLDFVGYTKELTKNYGEIALLKIIVSPKETNMEDYIL